MSHAHDTPVGAVWTALTDRLRMRQRLDELRPHARLDGLTALVTGASSGLGHAIAIGLGRQGARVLVPCRRDAELTARQLRAASGNSRIEPRELDLADLRSVHALADQLRDAGERLDVVVLNAAVVPASSRATPQGVELMFGVNYLAHALLLQRLLEDGVLPQTPNARGMQRRLIIVSSEAHRSAAPLNLQRLGEVVPYDARGAMAQYAHTKLLLCLLAAEQSRRLDGAVAVHALCPGPVNSRLAREAPAWTQPLLVPLMGLFFNPPERAAAPALHLASSPELEGETGIYFHMATRKEMSDAARDPLTGRALLEATASLLARVAPGRPAPGPSAGPEPRA